MGTSSDLLPSVHHMTPALPAGMEGRVYSYFRKGRKISCLEINHHLQFISQNLTIVKLKTICLCILDYLAMGIVGLHIHSDFRVRHLQSFLHLGILKIRILNCAQLQRIT